MRPRVVRFGRETSGAGKGVSLQEIREMRAKIPEELEVETFCHGAMCVSYSVANLL